MFLHHRYARPRKLTSSSCSYRLCCLVTMESATPPEKGRFSEVENDSTQIREKDGLSENLGHDAMQRSFVHLDEKKILRKVLLNGSGRFLIETDQTTSRWTFG